MSEQMPLTRRELRERERKEAAAAEPAPLTRRELRARMVAEAEPEPQTAERAAIRRRPVQAPTTTDSLTVVDPATGSVTEVPLTPAPSAAVGPVGPAPSIASEAPAPVVSAPTPAPVASPPVAPAPAGPAPEGRAPVPLLQPAPEGQPRRRSLRERDPLPDFGDQPLSVEQAAIIERRSRTGRPALAAVLRFIVLLLAAIVVGALIWVVADQAAAETTVAAAQPTPVGGQA